MKHYQQLLYTVGAPRMMSETALDTVICPPPPPFCLLRPHQLLHRFSAPSIRLAFAVRTQSNLAAGVEAPPKTTLQPAPPSPRVSSGPVGRPSVEPQSR